MQLFKYAIYALLLVAFVAAAPVENSVRFGLHALRGAMKGNVRAPTVMPQEIKIMYTMHKKRKNTSM